MACRRLPRVFRGVRFAQPKGVPGYSAVARDGEGAGDRRSVEPARLHIEKHAREYSESAFAQRGSCVVGDD